MTETEKMLLMVLLDELGDIVSSWSCDEIEFENTPELSELLPILYEYEDDWMREDSEVYIGASQLIVYFKNKFKKQE